MADIQPLPGICYAESANLAALVTPPYDVISPEAQERYYARSPKNIIRLELGRDEPGDDELHNRYSRAAATFAEWRQQGVFTQDAPALYLYVQNFEVQGKPYQRFGLLARVRLEPWSAGVVLPHERTLSKPKDDRLKLLRACAANLSPIMSLYDDPDGELQSILTEVSKAQSIANFTDEAGERHQLWQITDGAVVQHIADFFAGRQLYIADGHHRYETCLNYRDEQATQRKSIAADDPAHFTLMSLSAIEDPGLVVLPTHRILRDLDPASIATLDESLARYFTIEPLDPMEADALMAKLVAAGATGTPEALLVRPSDTILLTLRPEGRVAMATLEGEQTQASAAWRALDLAVLHELVVRRALGISPEMIQAGDHVSYTRDADAALLAVRTAGDGLTLALLVNPTPPVAIRDVARAGDRMPQKSTYFYPKLITGLVINPVW